MLSLFDLQSTASLGDVAELLGYKPKALAYILFKKPSATKYRTFEIAKASGGSRKICAPEPDLKLLQERLSKLLLNCLDEIRPPLAPSRRLSHGFERKLSIISNAERHRNRRHVFNLDLDDFFGRINFGRVRGFFINDKRFRLRPAVATVLAQIACHENALPQGSPCSPVISNLIAGILDLRLAALARKTGCRYSRYADDLTFSTNQAMFPVDIARQTASGSWEVGIELAGLIKRTGFDIQSSKTRMQFKRSRQSVTGLVVNSQVNVKKESRKLVRAMTYRLYTTGTYDIASAGVLSVSPGVTARQPGTWNQLSGAFGFVGSVTDHSRKRLNRRTPGNKTKTAMDEFHRRFLVFTEMYASLVPVVICEGKTDSVYVENAIRSLAAAFPTLQTKALNGSGIRFFKYQRTSTARRLGLQGGVATLATFIATYCDDLIRFTAPGSSRPLIILVDNDDASKSVLAVAKQYSKNKALSLASDYLHVTGNLYIVPVPPVPGRSNTVIEDLFPASVKATVLNGKTLHLGKQLDPIQHYGKHIFAERVIGPNAKQIDFSGFTKLLENLAKVIALFP